MTIMHKFEVSSKSGLAVLKGRVNYAGLFKIFQNRRYGVVIDNFS